MVTSAYKPQTLIGALFLCLRSKFPLETDLMPGSELSPLPTMLGGMETSVTLQDCGDHERLLVFDTLYPYKEKRDTVLLNLRCQKIATEEGGKKKCGPPIFIRHRKDLVSFDENGLLKDFLPAVIAVQNELSNLIKLGRYEIVKIEPVKKEPKQKEKEPAEGNVF